MEKKGEGRKNEKQVEKGRREREEGRQRGKGEGGRPAKRERSGRRWMKKGKKKSEGERWVDMYNLVTHL